MHKTDTISLRIQAELKREFFQYLKREGKEFSQWIRKAMTDELKRNREGQYELSRQERFVARQAKSNLK